MSERHNLPRLERECYQSFAVVHWTMKVEPSTVGWLDRDIHMAFRESLLHACARETLVCPTYCLMPDHLHMTLMGMSLESDQLNSIKFLRVHFNRLLAGEPLQSFSDSRALTRRGHIPESAQGWKLQPQAYDHILREEERKRNAFAKTCFYVLANPVRAELAKREEDWPFSGCMLPGYPDLHPMQPDFWELFWKLYWQHREPAPKEPRSLT